MIKIPICFSCEHYNSKTDSCSAYPDGFPVGFRIEKKDDGKECNNGYRYKKRIFEK